jgi:hypothetical protein
MLSHPCYTRKYSMVIPCAGANPCSRLFDRPIRSSGAMLSGTRDVNRLNEMLDSLVNQNAKEVENPTDRKGIAQAAASSRFWMPLRGQE